MLNEEERLRGLKEIEKKKKDFKNILKEIKYYEVIENFPGGFFKVDSHIKTKEEAEIVKKKYEEEKKFSHVSEVKIYERDYSEDFEEFLKDLLFYRYEVSIYNLIDKLERSYEND